MNNPSSCLLKKGEKRSSVQQNACCNTTVHACILYDLRKTLQQNIGIGMFYGWSILKLHNIVSSSKTSCDICTVLRQIILHLQGHLSRVRSLVSCNHIQQEGHSVCFGRFPALPQWKTPELSVDMKLQYFIGIFSGSSRTNIFIVYNS